MRGRDREGDDTLVFSSQARRHTNSPRAIVSHGDAAVPSNGIESRNVCVGLGRTFHVSSPLVHILFSLPHYLLISLRLYLSFSHSFISLWVYISTLFLYFTLIVSVPVAYMFYILSLSLSLSCSKRQYGSREGWWVGGMRKHRRVKVSLKRVPAVWLALKAWQVEPALWHQPSGLLSARAISHWLRAGQ